MNYHNTALHSYE